MIAVISPIKEADSGVIVTYPRIALKRPLGPDAATVGGAGDQDIVPPAQKQVKVKSSFDMQLLILLYCKSFNKLLIVMFLLHSVTNILYIITTVFR